MKPIAFQALKQPLSLISYPLHPATVKMAARSGLGMRLIVIGLCH